MVPCLMVAGATFYPLRKKKEQFCHQGKQKKKHSETLLVNFHKNQWLLSPCCATAGSLMSTRVPGESGGNEWESKIPARVEGRSVFINSVPHILFRGAAALPWCSLLMPHSCNQERDSNTCCFHHACCIAAYSWHRWLRSKDGHGGAIPPEAFPFDGCHHGNIERFVYGGAPGVEGS